jgi:DNA-binding NtrC family response regulator
LQQGEIEPVGGKKNLKVNVRIISATNRNLMADVKAGRFREDLFYRLHVFPLSVPPLRARKEDIAELARHFIARFAAEEGKRISGVSAEALTMFVSHEWPGNVRQLENAIFRGVVLAEGETLGINEFPQIAVQRDDSTAIVPDAPQLTMSPSALPLLNLEGDVRPLDDIEHEVIRFAIAHYRGQMSEVARRLRIGRSTLYRKLESLGLADENVNAG